MEDKQFENDENIKIVKEKKVLVSESRIKNTIKEYKKGQPLGWLLSSSFACLLSFFTAFATYPSNLNAWKWIFLGLSILSALVLLVSGVITLIRKKKSRGTEKWFLDEIKDEHPQVLKKQADPKKRKDCLFNFVNIVLLVTIPLSGYLIYLGCNAWNPYPNEMATLFWMIWSLISITYFIFGTFLNSTFAYILFGYERDDY